MLLEIGEQRVEDLGTRVAAEGQHVLVGRARPGADREHERVVRELGAVRQARDVAPGIDAGHRADAKLRVEARRDIGQRIVRDVIA